MKVKYLGTPECPDNIVIRQLRFETGKVCLIHDAGMAKKLSALPYFEEITDAKAKADAPEAAPAEPEMDDDGEDAVAEDAPSDDEGDE